MRAWLRRRRRVLPMPDDVLRRLAVLGIDPGDVDWYAGRPRA